MPKIKKMVTNKSELEAYKSIRWNVCFFSVKETNMENVNVTQRSVQVVKTQNRTCCLTPKQSGKVNLIQSRCDNLAYNGQNNTNVKYWIMRAPSLRLSTVADSNQNICWNDKPVWEFLELINEEEVQNNVANLITFNKQVYRKVLLKNTNSSVSLDVISIIIRKYCTKYTCRIDPSLLISRTFDISIHHTRIIIVLSHQKNNLCENISKKDVHKWFNDDTIYSRNNPSFKCVRCCTFWEI